MLYRDVTVRKRIPPRKKKGGVKIFQKFFQAGIFYQCYVDMRTNSRDAGQASCHMITFYLKYSINLLVAFNNIQGRTCSSMDVVKGDRGANLFFCNKSCSV
jgi:hypothetical protein